MIDNDKNQAVMTKYVTPSILYVLFVFSMTLTPFEFSQEWLLRFTSDAPSTMLGKLFYAEVKDVVQNILLFIPWGILVYHLIPPERSRGRWWVIPVITGLCLSVPVEILQMFMRRSTAVTDVLMNALGTVIGFYFLENKRLRARTRAFFKNLWSRWCVRWGVVAICAMAFVLFWILPSRLNDLGRWQPDYKLFVGNEVTLDRPWEGTIQRLAVYDRALEQPETMQLFTSDEASNVLRSELGAIVYYNFIHSQGDSILDRISSDRNLSLIGRGGEEIYHETGRRITRDRYYSSDPAGKSLSTELRSRSEFSVEVHFHPASLEAGGPARIVTLSQGPDERNFMIGQVDDDLHFRVRSLFADVWR